ncbi:lytic transglycosylase domain-containing protein [Actibacterium pelagium]|nr:lytic transglycosylase domain-containing protein [Actibacterium pelagium]
MVRIFMAITVIYALAAPGWAASVTEVMAAVRADKWDEAAQLTRRDDLMRDVVDWRRLRAGEGEFPEYLDFLSRNPDWPGLARVRLRAEERMPDNLSAEAVLDFFSAAPPSSGDGATRLALAYQALGQPEAASAIAVETWQTRPLTVSAQLALMTVFPQDLNPHHEARLDAMLWAGASESARRMYPLVSDGWERLAEARIALREKKNGVDARIDAVPSSLAGDAGLAWERFNWRANKGLTDSALELLEQRTGSKASLGQPEKWAKRRAVYVRRLMRDGEHRRAYRLASQHHLPEGSSFADLEWLSGYLSLRFLNEPLQALQHFYRFETAVQTPISLGRAGYWQGRALEELGQSDAAREAYAKGGQFQTSFYGQLAAEKAGIAPDVTMVGQGGLPDWRHAAFAKSDLVTVAKRFADAGERNLAEWFLTHLAESQNVLGQAQLADMALDWGEPHIALKIAKQAAGQGFVLPEPYFPLTELSKDNHGVPTELVLAIARRESEFDPAVTSGAGARGLMQLMPGTARDVSRDIGVGYNLSALLTDPQYNAQLGAAYLEQMIEKWGPSVVLVAASYNAGPHRATAWIERFGDPRSSRVDVIDWIEHIPFTETRNYVMRIAESLWVYETRLSGKAGPIGLSDTLRNGF